MSFDVPDFEYLEEKIPGSPLRQFTSKPESSARLGRPHFSTIWIVFNMAFYLKVLPISSGNGEAVNGGL